MMYNGEALDIGLQNKREDFCQNLFHMIDGLTMINADDTDIRCGGGVDRSGHYKYIKYFSGTNIILSFHHFGLMILFYFYCIFIGAILAKQPKRASTYYKSS